MSELIDLVDKDGKILEYAVPRDDLAHYDNLHMQIAVVVIKNSLGAVLVHERSAVKKVAPGKVDLVCGAVKSGKTPEWTAFDEATDEVHVKPENLRKAWAGVNAYERYCHLFVGDSEYAPTADELDPDEVAWAAYYLPEDLRAKEKTGEFKFVDCFFEDLDHALNPQHNP